MDSSIGPYSILRLINQGGQGEVYLGYDRRLHRQVAIKIYQLPGTRAARRQILGEAQRVAAIQNPRVVQVYDVIQSSDYLAMVMEYVPGCDLEEFISRQQPSVASVVSVATDLAAGLAASRQQGLVHGDLKAANVLVTAQGRVKLTDFGIARVTPEEPRQWQAGSLSALAPEQLAGQALDVRTDLFALGRLLYRLLTGEHSYARAGVPDAQVLLQEEQGSVRDALPHGVEVPPELLSLIDQLLRKEPVDRPGNTHQVRRMLRSASRQLPLSAADSLLREASPYFRPESPADIPPEIPRQLRQRGRSSSTQGRIFTAWMPAISLRRAQYGMAALLLMVAAIPLVAGLLDEVKFVHIQAPSIGIAPAVTVPDSVTGPALVELVREEVAAQLGAVRFSGAVKKRIIYADEDEAKTSSPDESIALSLSCVELFCVFSLQRQLGEKTHYKQELLLPDLPPEQWRRQIREATASLYP